MVIMVLQPSRVKGCRPEIFFERVDVAVDKHDGQHLDGRSSHANLSGLRSVVKTATRPLSATRIGLAFLLDNFLALCYGCALLDSGVKEEQ